MDTLSHGLWGGILFGRSGKKAFWLSFAFGSLPDVLVFGPTFAMLFFAFITGGETSRPDPPDIASMPRYITAGYDITHSLIVFAIAFAAIWLLRRKPLYEMLAWPAHIVLDVPTHTTEFFPTPYLWPLAHPEVNGISWSHPLIFIPNVILLAVLYCWFYVVRPRLRKRKANEFLGEAHLEI